MHIDIFSGMNRSPSGISVPIRTAFKAIFMCHHLLTCMHTKTHKSKINVMRSGYDEMVCTLGSCEVITAIYHSVIYGIIININGGD